MDPHFNMPPVKERVISLQFEEIPIFTNAHAGWFWKSFLDDEWSSVNEAPRIQNYFERFGAKKLRAQQAQLQFATEPRPERYQIVRESDDRMIQLQNSRFTLNWRKKEDEDYPDYEDLYKEYLHYFNLFRKFIRKAGNDDLKLNQWEITYVNHIPKGVLWNSIKDWFELFPGLSLPNVKDYESQLDTIRLNWSIGFDDIGRLHINLFHALAGRSEGDEVAGLELVCRGAVDENHDFEEGLNFGHDKIVTTFTAITSKNAHKIWERTS